MSEHALKEKGNESFKLKKFPEAEQFYKQALAAISSTANDGDRDAPSIDHVLFSNLAAVYFEQRELERCIEAADHAIALQPSWLKAYFRKAQALEALITADPQAVLAVWEDAARHCESCALLKKQLLTAKVRWLQHFKQVPVTSSQDLLARYALLTDPRQKLSTLAHFWNASSESERLQHFQHFLGLIAGAGETPQGQVQVAEAQMMALPLHNYHDLPRASIEPWCSHFESCAAQEKTRVLAQVWGLLSDHEQTAVIADLQAFLGEQAPEDD